MKARTSACAAIVATLVTCGCATRPEIKVVRSDGLAVVTAQYAPDAHFNAYAYGTGANTVSMAAEHALKGAAVGAYPGLVISQHPITAIVGIPLAVIGAAVGSVAGAAGGAIGGVATGLPSDQVSAIHRPVTEARRPEIQASVIPELIAARPQARVIHLPQLGPRFAGDEPRYEALKESPFHSVLELSITGIGFEAKHADPPTAAFQMTAQARVVPLREGAEPWVRHWTHKGETRNVTDWQADGNALLQQELNAALRAFATNVSYLLTE